MEWWNTKWWDNIMWACTKFSDKSLQAYKGKTNCVLYPNYYIDTHEPIIHDFPNDLEACEGEYVILYVTATGAPPPILTWYHDNEGITTDSSIEISADGTLSIPSMEKKHEGIYRLVASNTYGSCYEELALMIEDEETFTLRRAESMASMIDNSPVPVSSFEEYVALHHRKNNEAFHFQFSVCAFCKLHMHDIAHRSK